MTQIRWRVPPTQLARQYRQHLAQGLNEAASELLTDANTTVPIDEGVLEGSGDIQAATAGSPQAHVYYDTPYAVIQHEDLTLNHPNGRRGAWLELTLAEQRARYQRIVAQAVRKATGG